jgi:hypothetical protein
MCIGVAIMNVSRIAGVGAAVGAGIGLVGPFIIAACGGGELSPIMVPVTVPVCAVAGAVVGAIVGVIVRALRKPNNPK